MLLFFVLLNGHLQTKVRLTFNENIREGGSRD